MGSPYVYVGLHDVVKAGCCCDNEVTTGWAVVMEAIARPIETTTNLSAAVCDVAVTGAQREVAEGASFNFRKADCCVLTRLCELKIVSPR